MKAIVIAVILGIAALVGVQAYLSITGQDCPNGRIVADEAACRGVFEFDEAFCRAAFSRARDVVAAAGSTFPTQDDCLARGHPVCDPVETPRGHWTPRPAGFCVARGAQGQVLRMTPVYQGHGQRVGR